VDSRARILVVDDEPFIRTLVQSTIETMGHLARPAEDGAAARDLLAAEPIDLILTDLLMPRMSGLELLRHTRRVHPGIPVIILTGYASLETALSAIHEGVYDYLTKPFQIDELRLTVRNALGHIAAARENRRLVLELDEAMRRISALEGAIRARDAETASALHEGHRAAAERIDRLRAFQNRLLPYQYAPAATGPGGARGSLAALIELRDSGAITDPEFLAFKKRIHEG
jgi:DNA-binding NtrC family response regulator